MGEDSMKTNTNTEQQRAQLLSMIHGTDGAPRLYFYMAGYTLLCTDVEDTTKPAQFSMPTDEDGKRLFLGAFSAASKDGGATPQKDATQPATASLRGKAANFRAAWEYFGDEAADEDIAVAMKQRPCLVNYGGTLRAHNPEADGELCFIIKDMAA